MTDPKTSLPEQSTVPHATMCLLCNSIVCAKENPPVRFAEPHHCKQCGLPPGWSVGWSHWIESLGESNV